MIKLPKILICLLMLQNYLELQAQQTTTLFCHGIVDNKNQADKYKDFLDQPMIAFNFPDAQKPINWDLNNLIFKTCSLFGKQVNRNNMYMGQDADIETLKSQIETDTNYILYGHSRGGATIINYLAQYNPANIQAIILDATPADVVAIIDDLQYKIGCKFAPDRSTQEYIFRLLFPAYPKKSIAPLQDITNIKNKRIPILIVHSHTDTRVHIRSAWQLYTAFIQADFTNVYLCELSDGNHSHYMYGNDKDTYLQAIHSFYKAHGFTYNPIHALMDLDNLRVNLEVITNKISTDQDQLIKDYETQKTVNQTAASIIISAAIIFTMLKYNDLI